MKAILLIAITLMLIVIFSIDGKGQDRQVQMKLDSVQWEKPGKAVLYGTTPDLKKVTFYYGYHRGFFRRTGKILVPGIRITIQELPGPMKDGRKRSKLIVNN